MHFASTYVFNFNQLRTMSKKFHSTFIRKRKKMLGRNECYRGTDKGTPHLLVGLRVLHHVLVCVSLGIDAGLRALHWKRKGIHDYESIAFSLPLHQAHDLDGSAGAGVHYHLQQCKCGDLHATEVVGILPPGFLLLELGLRRLVVEVDRVRISSGCYGTAIHRHDVVLQLPCLPRQRRRRVHRF